MSDQLERLMREQRSALDGPERAVVGAVRGAWVETFGSLELDLRLVLDRIETARLAGETIDDDWLRREPFYRRLQARLGDVRRRFVDRALLAIVTGQQTFSRLGRLDSLAQLGMIGVAVPPVAPIAVVPQGTPEAVLRPVLDGLAQLTVAAVAAQVDLTPQDGPRPPRSPLLRILDDPATDARTRTIIRSEVMRTYRSAARNRHIAAGDVLQGVQWIASLSPRTCLACLGRHGDVFPVGYVMEAHPACRCSLAPLAANTPSAVPETGAAWFARQPEAFQRQRMGTAYEAYRDGQVTLADFVGMRESARWGRSIQQRSQRDVLASAKNGSGGGSSGGRRGGGSSGGGDEPPNESHSINPAVRRGTDGVWGSDRLPVTDWEAPEHRVVLTTELQQALDVPEPVLRWSRRKHEIVEREHRQEAEIEMRRNLSQVLAGWSYAGRSSSAVDAWEVFVFFDGRWAMAVLGEDRAGLVNFVTTYRPARGNSLANRIRRGQYSRRPGSEGV